MCIVAQAPLGRRIMPAQVPKTGGPLGNVSRTGSRVPVARAGASAPYSRRQAVWVVFGCCQYFWLYLKGFGSKLLQPTLVFDECPLQG